MQGDRTPDLIDTFRLIYDDLVSMLRRRTGDAHRAEDIAQDTYFRLVQARKAGTEVRNPRAFVLRVAGNLLIDEGRRQERQRRRNVSDTVVNILPDLTPSAEEALIARERLKRLEDALQTLPEKPRQALLLNRVEGLTQAEIARRLGVSESMVVKYVAQALSHCRRHQKRIDG